jgi:putative transcriptional regulator
MTNIQDTLSEMAKDLYEVGAIDKTTLRQFDLNSLPPVPNYSANQIANLRHKLGLEVFQFCGCDFSRSQQHLIVNGISQNNEMFNF